MHQIQAVGRPSDVHTPPRIGVHLSLCLRVVVETRWKRAFPLHSGVPTWEEKVGSTPGIERTTLEGSL